MECSLGVDICITNTRNKIYIIPCSLFMFFLYYLSFATLQVWWSRRNLVSLINEPKELCLSSLLVLLDASLFPSSNWMLNYSGYWVWTQKITTHNNNPPFPKFSPLSLITVISSLVPCTRNFPQVQWSVPMWILAYLATPQ